MVEMERDSVNYLITFVCVKRILVRTGKSLQDLSDRIKSLNGNCLKVGLERIG